MQRMIRNMRAFVGSVWVACALLGGCVGGQSGGGELDRAALERFVESAMTEQVAVEEAQAIYESLNDAEQGVITEILKEQLRTEEQSQLAADGPAQAAGSIWTEYIENVWTDGLPPGSVFGASAYVDWNCDDDPTDKEYVIYYPFPAVSPAGIRWTTTSSQVYLAFMVAYGGNLLGFGYHHGEARLCIGDKGVALAGGPLKVQSTVFLHY